MKKMVMAPDRVCKPRNNPVRELKSASGQYTTATPKNVPMLAQCQGLEEDAQNRSKS
jgi:hypothetical protein